MFLSCLLCRCYISCIGKFIRELVKNSIVYRNVLEFGRNVFKPDRKEKEGKLKSGTLEVNHPRVMGVLFKRARDWQSIPSYLVNALTSWRFSNEFDSPNDIDVFGLKKGGSILLTSQHSSVEELQRSWTMHAVEGFNKKCAFRRLNVIRIKSSQGSSIHDMTLTSIESLILWSKWDVTRYSKLGCTLFTWVLFYTAKCPLLVKLVRMINIHSN